MLTKQWQMGEFRGSDAGSPVFAKLQIDTTRLTKYQSADGKRPSCSTYNIPLEAKVERRPIPVHRRAHPSALDLRLVMGTAVVVADRRHGRLRQRFITRTRLPPPTPPRKRRRHLRASRAFAGFTAVAGRAMDGARFTRICAIPGIMPTTASPPSIQATVPRSTTARALLAWFERVPRSRLTATMPGSPSDWNISSPLPHRCPGGEKVYVADEYYSGPSRLVQSRRRCLFEALEPVPGSGTLASATTRRSPRFPFRSRSPGMPNTRWWTFEDRKPTSATSTPARPTSPNCSSSSSHWSMPTTGS